MKNKLHSRKSKLKYRMHKDKCLSEIKKKNLQKNFKKEIKEYFS